MITEVENTLTLTGNRALVTEQAAQNGFDPALGVGRSGIKPASLFASDGCHRSELYEYVFAPWVITGLREFKVRPGIVSAMFPQNDALNFQRCGMWSGNYGSH
jgi:hypothetical protein